MKLINFLGVCLLVIGCNPKKETSTQTLYFNGDIITMHGKQAQYVEALVEEAGKIVFIGPKSEALKNFNPAATIDLQGKTMLPAFLDGHGHFYSVGFNALCANLLPPPDGPGSGISEIIRTMQQYKNSEEGKYMIDKMGWIIGNGYDDSQLEEKEHPKASDLDNISTEIPVLIIHQSGHLASVNTKALELLHYTENTKNPTGGIIRRDKNNKPSGVLEETAFFNALMPLLGNVDPEIVVKSIQKGQYEYAKNGYLTAQDGRTTIEQLSYLKKAANDSLYFIDVVAYPDISLGTDYIQQGDYQPSPLYKNKFRVGGVKLSLDGSPQGKTAWLTQCYHKNPEGKNGCYTGYPSMNTELSDELIRTAFKNKWQILCHANGDAAIDQFLNGLRAAEDSFGYDNHRSVLIHGQTLRKNQIPALVELAVLPSLFPMHTFYWGDWHRESVLGEPRAEYISPCRDVIDAGLTITSHHDAPVTFPNAMRVLDATVNRITRSGKILGPDQRITVYEGLKTLTEWAAYQYFEEDTKGTLETGKLADFVILNQNPLKINPLNIHTIQVVQSIKKGKKVFEKK